MHQAGMILTKYCHTEQNESNLHRLTKEQTSHDPFHLLIKLQQIHVPNQYTYYNYHCTCSHLSCLSYFYSLLLPSSISLSCWSTTETLASIQLLQWCPNCHCDERSNLQGNVFRCHWPDSGPLFAHRIQRCLFSGIMGTPTILCICVSTHH